MRNVQDKSERKRNPVQFADAPDFKTVLAAVMALRAEALLRHSPASSMGDSLLIKA